jgi:hypothetical protein
MSGTEPISDTDGLTTWMRDLWRAGGGPADFEAAVRSDAPRLDVRLAWQPLLSLARVGSESPWVSRPRNSGPSYPCSAR